MVGHQYLHCNRHWCFSDGSDRGRGGGDQAGDQRVEEVLPPQEYRHLLRRFHQEIPTGKGWCHTYPLYLQYLNSI
jgi:hypothetical protein